MIRNLTFLLTILNFATAFSQQQFTFKDAIQKAESNNPDLKIESYKLGYSDADITTAGLRPNLIFNNQLLQLMDASNKAPGSNLLGGANRQIWYQLTKPIQLSQIRQKKIDLAQQGKSVSQLEIDERKRTIFYESGTRWLDLWFHKVNLTIFLDAKDNVDTLVTINETRLRNGFITPIDLLRTKLLSKQYELELLTIRQTYTNEINEFKVFLNIQDSIDVNESMSINILPLPQSQDSLITYALNNRKDIIVLKAGLDWNKKNQILQRALKAPYLEAGVIFNPQNTVPYAGTFATLSIPIFDKNQGEIQRASIALDQNNSMLQYKESQIRNEVQNAYKTYTTNRLVMERFQNILDESKQVLNTVKYSYLKGNTTIIDFLEAQRSYLSTQELYNEAIYKYRKSYLEILYVSGLINTIQ